MWNRRNTAAFALLALAAWACTPDDYPTEPRFEVPDVIELPDGELFFYTPPAGVNVTSVSLRGSFNEWGETPMTRLSDGRWVAGVELEPGTYEYKYFFNGADWSADMCNDPVYGDPANGGKVDASVAECIPGGNAIRQVGTPGHTFLYIVPEGVDVEVVTAAGTFQPDDAEWNQHSDTLTNIWEYTVELEPGTYQYKYQFNTTDGWAGNMCDETNWGNPEFGNAVDPDNDNCSGDNAVITIEEAGPHTFRYIVPADADSISQITIAGEFQEAPWTPGVDFFQETFQRRYDLEPGTYEYKFIFDGSWAGNMCTTGPDGGKVDANGSGTCNGDNAVIVVE